jgi:subtilisin
MEGTGRTDRRRHHRKRLAGTGAALAAVVAVTLMAAPPSSADRRHRAEPAVAATGPGGVPATGPAAAPREAGRLPGHDHTRTVAPAAAFDRLGDEADRAGTVPVIAGLRTAFTPEGQLAGAQAASQHARIAQARTRLLGSLAGTRFELVRSYRTLPFVALRLTPAALDALRRSGQAATLAKDELSGPELAQSTQVVEATEGARLSRDGAGQHVAILDTGVERTHPFLRQTPSGPSKVVAEACFSAEASCPNGQQSQIAPGAGRPCTYAASGCRHGTHVAGIAAGKGSRFSGVAPGAKLVAVQVFSRFTGGDCAGAGEDPCTLSYTSDQLAGLEYVLGLQPARSIASVNLSLGGGHHVADCPDHLAGTYKPAVDNLRSVGIATVVASGNEGFNDGVAAPACVPTVITVGATTKADQVWERSNSSSQVELLAPGVGINSSVPGGRFAVFNGTSMATPHVAGAWAVMRQVHRTASVDAVLAALRTTGLPVADPDNGVTAPRIRVLSASVFLRDTGFRDAGRFAYRGGGVASNGSGLARRAGGPASSWIRLGGIPAGARVRNAYLYWMTIGGPDDLAFYMGFPVRGTLVGASRDTCWNVNQSGPNRLYRARLPAWAAPRNGSYLVGGIGGSGGVDGQGASLVVVYSQASSSLTGRVYLRHGATTVNQVGQTMEHSFAGLSVPARPASARLHVGVGDGQAFTDTPMRFAGAPVTGPNAFSASDGPMWDDLRVVLPTALLPAGTTRRTNAITAAQDCLAWGYSALTYQYRSR